MNRKKTIISFQTWVWMYQKSMSKKLALRINSSAFTKMHDGIFRIYLRKNES